MKASFYILKIKTPLGISNLVQLRDETFALIRQFDDSDEEIIQYFEGHECKNNVWADKFAQYPFHKIIELK